MALYAVKDDVEDRKVPVIDGDDEKDHKIEKGRVYDDGNPIDRQVIRQAPDCFVLGARGAERAGDPLARPTPGEEPNPLATGGTDDEDIVKARDKAVKTK